MQNDKAFLLRWNNIIRDIQVNLVIHHDDMPVLREGDLRQLWTEVGSRPTDTRGTGSLEVKDVKDSKTVKILQFSDVHLDHFYEPVSSLFAGWVYWPILPLSVFSGNSHRLWTIHLL